MGELAGFAYGEDREQGSGRSLGYRLLAPAAPRPWGAEAEALARRLQAAPYPDHWPATDLFCSVLLADGHRLVALARYGLADHTPGQRRGGLELVGVVGPAALDVPTALALYAWLRRRRAAADDLHSLGGDAALGEVLAGAAPGARPEGVTGPVPVLPVRLWQDGAFLFAAAAPSDPDHHLRLLELGAGPGWQWLPLVGPDFPLPQYAQRGPLVAWTPHLAGVALKLDRKGADPVPVPTRPPQLARSAAVVLVLLLAGLLAGNLWFLREVRQQLAAASPPAKEPAPAPAKEPARPRPTGEPDLAGRERFAAALHQVLVEKGGREWAEGRPDLLERYEAMAARQPDLRLRSDDDRGKVAVAALAVLAGRGADRIEEEVRKALADKGYSDKLVQAACEQVRKQFAEGLKGGP